MQDEDTEAAIRQELEDMGTAENVRLMTREPKKTLEVMMVAFRDSLSNLASSDDGENGEDEDDEETAQGKLSEDDKPGWVMGKISKMVEQRLERSQRKQMKHDELTQPG